MPVAARPDPLPLLNAPSPAPTRAAGGAPSTGPGSFSNALAQAQPAPMPEREVERPRAQEGSPSAQTAARPPEAQEPAQPRGADAQPTTATQRGAGPRAKPAPGQAPETATASRPEPLAPAPSAASAQDPAAQALVPPLDEASTGPEPKAEPALWAGTDPLPPAPAAQAPTHRVLGAAVPSGEAAPSPGAGRDTLRPIAANLPATLTRPGPQLDVDTASAADDEVPTADSPSLALVGQTRRAAAALGMGADNAAPPASAPAAPALTPTDLPARAAAAWLAEGRGAAPVREPGLARVEGALSSMAGWAGAPAALGAPPASANPAMAAVAPALNHPDFAQALGTQVALWAADGQHEAELHLNPGSMGPVQVWIGVDGAQAHVRFSADLAPTREALQAALPQLEQALAREGLQLGGADVQSRDPRAGAGSLANGDPDGSRRGRGGSAADGRGPLGEPEALSRTPRPPGASRGLLDLYA